MPERDRGKAALPTVSLADRPRVSSRDSTRSASTRFGSLSSAFFRKSEERDPAMGIRRMLVERDRDKSLNLSRANVATIGSSVPLLENQNKLLAEIIREVRAIQPRQGNQNQNDLDALDGMIDRIRQRAKPGRGRFGSAGRKRLARIRALREAKSRAPSSTKPSAPSRDAKPSRPRPSTTASKPPTPAVRPRVEPRIQAPAVQPSAPTSTPDSQRVRPPSEIRASPTDRPEASAASRSALKQRISRSIRDRIGRAVLGVVPAAAVGFGLFFGAQRAMAGDFVGAGLEIAAGTTGAFSFTGFGAAVSLGLSASLLTRDIYNELYGVYPEVDPLREERFDELLAVVDETAREIASERPTPRIPEYTSESREQLRELYLLAQEDSALREAMGGESVMGPLAAQLRLRPGRATARGFDTALRTIQSRLLRSGRALSSAPTVSDLISPTSNIVEQTLDNISSTEFNSAIIDADIIEYEGRVIMPSTRVESEFMVPTAARTPAAVAAAPVNIPNAVPPRTSQSIPGMTGGTAGSTGGAIGGEQPSDDFMSEVNRVSSKFGVNPSDMLALMRSESSLNPQAVNRTTGATGLIQFMPATARSLGTTTEELRQMTAAQQMRYVEKFFDSVRLPQGASAGQLYAYVFLPGRARREVLTTAGEAFYEANRGLDMNSDGRITIADLDARMARFGGSVQVSRMNGGATGGIALAGASGGMAAADQAQMMGAGNQVVIQPSAQVGTTGPGAIPSVLRGITGDTPLNRRLEQQVS
jgi:hypothetical protein